MNSYLTKLLVGAAAAALFVPMSAMAQKSGGGVIGDARLHPGTWNNQRTSTSRMRSQPTYRNSAPIVVQSERAPEVVAQAPTERRSFSYEPSQQAPPVATQSGGCGCGNNARTEKATAEPSTESRRSFSYEPSKSETSAPQRSYSTPRMRSSESSKLPRTSGTKAERNNYRN